MTDTTTTATPAISPEQVANDRKLLDELAAERVAKAAAKAHDDMVADLCATDSSFKPLWEQYKNDVMTLKPSLKTITDKKQFINEFLAPATLLSERDKKIAAQTTASAVAPVTADNPELDRPLPQANGTYKNGHGDVVDKDGMKLLSEKVNLPDLRDYAIPTDAAPAVQARLAFAKEGQKAVKSFEKPKW